MFSEKERALLGDREAQEAITARGQLLPCPKCGDNKEVSIATATRIPREFWGTCWACGFCGPIELSVSKAIESWNHRATEIEKYAIKTACHNFPNIEQLGDAFQVREWGDMG